MPNHVRNALRFNCSKDRRDEILREIQNDELGSGSIDFNKVIPMPDSLDMPSGSMEDNAISLYLTAVNPDTRDYGFSKLTALDFQALTDGLSTKVGIDQYDTAIPDEKLTSMASYLEYDAEHRGKPGDEIVKTAIEQGRQYVHNLQEYGCTTWYGWCNRNWGTKWNAYDSQSANDGSVIFNTAWVFPEPIIQALSEKYPDVDVINSWADEDLGNNVEEVEYRNGEVVSSDMPAPGSREAYEMAAGLWNYDLSAMGYSLSNDGSTYIYQEDLEDLDARDTLEMEIM